jgi:hypothetical protein
MGAGATTLGACCVGVPQKRVEQAPELFEEKQPSDHNIEHAENDENHREKRIFGYL